MDVIFSIKELKVLDISSLSEALWSTILDLIFFKAEAMELF